MEKLRINNSVIQLTNTNNFNNKSKIKLIEFSQILNLHFANENEARYFNQIEFNSFFDEILLLYNLKPNTNNNIFNIVTNIANNEISIYVQSLITLINTFYIFNNEDSFIPINKHFDFFYLIPKASTFENFIKLLQSRNNTRYKNCIKTKKFLLLSCFIYIFVDYISSFLIFPNSTTITIICNHENIFSKNNIIINSLSILIKFVNKIIPQFLFFSDSHIYSRFTENFLNFTHKTDNNILFLSYTSSNRSLTNLLTAFEDSTLCSILKKRTYYYLDNSLNLIPYHINNESIGIIFSDRKISKKLQNKSTLLLF